MPAVKYKPSADCAYTQLISKIKGVPILTETNSDRSGTSSPAPQSPKPQSPKPQSPKPSTNSTEVEVKKISSGLMLAQYYNSDSDEDSDDQSNGIIIAKSVQQTNGNSTVSNDSQPTPEVEPPIPAGIVCPPSELRVIIDKTAAYVLKNGKEFEDILRSKNDERFTFLQYKNQYHKYYTYKVTGIVCPDPISISNVPVEFAKKSENDPGKINHEMNKQIGEFF